MSWTHLLPKSLRAVDIINLNTVITVNTVQLIGSGRDEIPALSHKELKKTYQICTL